MCHCGNECVGEVCRKCMLDARRRLNGGMVNCVKCGAEIRVGFVSIKGRCEACHQNREAFADFVKHQSAPK